MLEKTPANYCKFFVHIGDNFENENDRILFVGRALNGGNPDSDDIDVLFGKNDGSIVYCKDEDNSLKLAGKDATEGNYRYTSSAFWRVIKGVSTTYFHDNWCEHIAWSNLYKVSPSGANPSLILRKKTFKTNLGILMSEIKNLSPKITIMLTGTDWAELFIEKMNGKMVGKSVKWGEYKGSPIYSILYKTDDFGYIIVSKHPQALPEQPHIDAINSLISSITTK